MTCASSIYSTIYDQMKPEFGISTELATLGLSTFNLGLALGPLLLSPLSEFYGEELLTPFFHLRPLQST